MQQERPRRSNRERTESTRTELIAAARRLFVDKGYADTSTPEIVAAAGLTRGALYHHFPEKQALFRAVVETEARQVAAEIATAAPDGMEPVSALLAGADAFLAAMRTPGRTRLLLLDGPAVLGRETMDAIDLAIGAMRTLRTGLDWAMTAGAIVPLPLEAITGLLSAAFDRAALAASAGAPPQDYRTSIEALLRGLARNGDEAA